MALPEEQMQTHLYLSGLADNARQAKQLLYECFKLLHS